MEHVAHLRLARIPALGPAALRLVIVARAKTTVALETVTRVLVIRMKAVFLQMVVADLTLLATRRALERSSALVAVFMATVVRVKTTVVRLIATLVLVNLVKPATFGICCGQ
jgi:hypothetical protein